VKRPRLLTLRGGGAWLLLLMHLDRKRWPPDRVMGVRGSAGGNPTESRLWGNGTRGRSNAKVGETG
jgi:hypothetical protein